VWHSTHTETENLLGENIRREPGESISQTYTTSDLLSPLFFLSKRRFLSYEESAFFGIMSQNYSTLLITGGSGFLGWNLARVAAAKSYDVSFTYGQHPLAIPHCREYHLDLHDRQQLEDVIEAIAPDAIIHTAALANADVCEKRRSAAYDINVAATERIAQCAEERNCRLLYISTDLVFDGRQGNYAEQDRPNPLNYYAESKLLGEKAVKAVSSNYLIMRTALMYGQGNGVHGSFLEWMHRNLQSKQPVSLFTDQYRTPLFVHDAAHALLEIMESSAGNDTFHLGGAQRLNRCEFGEIFARIFGYDQALLRPVTMQDVPSNAARGADCSLNSTKIQQELSFQLSDVAAGLRQLYQSGVS